MLFALAALALSEGCVIHANNVTIESADCDVIKALQSEGFKYEKYSIKYDNKTIEYEGFQDITEFQLVEGDFNPTSFLGIVNLPKLETFLVEKEVTWNKRQKGPIFNCPVEFTEHSELTEIQWFNVNEIEISQFSNHQKLKTVEIPLVATIAKESFKGCHSLSTIKSDATSIGDSAFYDCHALSDFSFEKVTRINESAFANTAIKNVISKVCTYIGPSAFTNTAVVEIKLEGKIEIVTAAFENCTLLNLLEVPNAFRIHSRSFHLCKSLQHVSAPKLEIIGNRTFQECTSLKTAKLPNIDIVSDHCFAYSTIESVEFDEATEIQESCFSKCANLVNITCPHVTVVGVRALAECTSLAQIEFLELQQIGESSFFSCTKLEYASIPHVSVLSASSFESCVSLTNIKIKKASSVLVNAFLNCYNLKSFNFSHVNTVLNYAFKNCSSLTSAVMPNLETIGIEAFVDCVSLETVSLGQVSLINDNVELVFRNCIKLHHVALPKLNSIPEDTDDLFINCPSLARVDLPSIPPKTFNESIFIVSGSKNIVLCLPFEGNYPNYQSVSHDDKWKGLSTQVPENYLDVCSGYGHTGDLPTPTIPKTSPVVLALSISIPLIIVIGAVSGIVFYVIRREKKDENSIYNATLV